MRPVERFTHAADHYRCHRPGYPRAMMDYLTGEKLVDFKDVIADVGCGTGLLAERFLENGNFVHCVEPNRKMREAGVSYLKNLGFTRFDFTDASAENTGLAEGSVEVIAAGQAFHWFDPAPCKVEFKRILKNKRLVVLAWNIRLENASPFDQKYEALLIHYGKDYLEIKNMADAGKIRRFFEPEAPVEMEFPNDQWLDRGGVRGRLLSSSFLPRPGEANCAEMLEKADELFEEFNENGRVRLSHSTKVFWGRLVAG